MHDLTEIRDVAVELATRASRLLLDNLSDRRTTVDTKTSDTDMVTEIDRASEALIVEGLRRHRPDDAILGEEGTRSEGTSGVQWVIDPLDGTTNYLYGLPAYAVSVAAEFEDRVIVGVVTDPSRDEVFMAVTGGGAFCNGIPIRVSEATELSTSLIATGFGYRADQRARQSEVLTTVLPAVRDIRRYGAAALDMCWVGCGRIDGYYESGIQHWDVAAGALVAAEAGAFVEGLDLVRAGDDNARVIAASPGLADALRGLLDRSTPRTPATRS